MSHMCFHQVTFVVGVHGTLACTHTITALVDTTMMPLGCHVYCFHIKKSTTPPPPPPPPPPPRTPHERPPHRVLVLTGSRGRRDMLSLALALAPEVRLVLFALAFLVVQTERDADARFWWIVWKCAKASAGYPGGRTVSLRSLGLRARQCRAFARRTLSLAVSSALSGPGRASAACARHG